MTRSLGWAGVAGVLLLALGAALAGAEAPRPVFGVGVLRRDGIIVPFGAFDGKRWSNNWPAPQDDLTVPINVRDVPSRWWGPTSALQTWQAWTGAGPQTLDIVQLDWIDAQCVRQIGLRSNFRPPTAAPPPTEQPYPKEGLAVSPPQPVEAIAIVPAESADAKALAPVLLEAFNAAERVVADAHGHPVSRRGREGRVPDIEAIYAVGDHPRVYYVEATRRYRQLGQRADECAAMAFGTGWFVRDGAQVRSLDTAGGSVVVRSGRRQLHVAARRDPHRRQAVLARAVFRLEPRAVRRGRGQTQDRRSGAQRVGGIVSNVEVERAGRAGWAEGPASGQWSPPC